MSARAIQLHKDDNVCVGIEPLTADETIDLPDGPVTVREPIPAGHKMAIRPVAAGTAVVKYGQIIGEATADIEPGGWVHSHNLAMVTFNRDAAMCSAVPPPPEPLTGYTFDGYRRANGTVGTRNYIAVISSVNCSASASRFIARHFSQYGLDDYPHVDGVVALTHHSGCGMPFGGQGHDMLNRVLAGMANHPNIAGYVLVGLGCEQATVQHLMEREQLVAIHGVGEPSAAPPPVLVLQELGGTAKTVEAGIRCVEEMLPRVNAMRREPVAASHLVVGTECGGSDGNSGITANPALGVAADRVVACGGTVMLSETTEMFGAEHLLTRRARSPEVAEKLLERIRWWQWYVGLFGAALDNNPSVGNKAGGLTTIAEKSLGAVAKGGSTTLQEVYQYAERVTQKGFVVMDTPGYDPPSVTGMVAGGANVIVFTTGRGSCFGCKPTPSIKVATNSAMYQRMKDDMDINAGVILEGESVESVGQTIFEKILQVASGKRTKSEQLGVGDDEFLPWIVGPVL